MSSDSAPPFKQGDLALVVGATGFIGQHLVTALQQRGYRVRVYSRRDHAANVLPGVASDDWFSGALEDANTHELTVTHTRYFSLRRFMDFILLSCFPPARRRSLLGLSVAWLGLDVAS